MPLDQVGRRRAVIGVWTEHDEGSRWANEGMTRLLGYLIEGAAERGQVSFRVVVPRPTYQEALADLRCLRAREGVDWTLETPPPAPEPPPLPPLPALRPSLPVRALRRLARRLGALGRLATSGVGRASLDQARACAERAAALRDRILAELRGGPDAALAEAALAKDHVREVLERVVREAASAAEDADAARAAGDVGAMVDACQRAADHCADAARIASDMRGWAGPRLRLRHQLEWARTHMAVDGWLLLFPYHLHATGLPGRRVAIFPDMIGVNAFIDPVEGNWGAQGYMRRWRDLTELTLPRCDGAVTFSDHMAAQLAGPPFRVPRERIHVVPLAPPDLSPELPFLAEGHGPASRARAAALLRAEAGRRGLPYLADFPFEQGEWIAVSTQDRQTKNIGAICDAIQLLVQRERLPVKMLATAGLKGDAPWQRLRRFIEAQGMQHDILSLPDLPRPEHAALYHCASLAVHASFIEGGRGVFPFYEAVSLGTPCLMGNGPHGRELLGEVPELAPWVFDPYDAEALARLIAATLPRRAEALAVQRAAYERLRRRGWADAAEGYARAVLGDAPAHSAGA